MKIPEDILLRYQNTDLHPKGASAHSSSIQTVLSVPESHRFCAETLADFTAGGEFHPALKIYVVFYKIA